MSRIKATQLLKVEDFSGDEKKWIGKLISPINDFINQTIRIINGGIKFTDNSLGVDRLFTFTYQSEAISFPQGFQWDLLAKPEALSVVAAYEDNAPFIAAVAWQYTVDGKISLTSVVKLTNAPAVTLLNVGSKYQIRVRVTP